MYFDDLRVEAEVNKLLFAVEGSVNRSGATEEIKSLPEMGDVSELFPLLSNELQDLEHFREGCDSVSVVDKELGDSQAIQDEGDSQNEREKRHATEKVTQGASLL